MDNKVCQTHTQEFIDQTQAQFIIAGFTLLKVVSGESLPLCREFYQVVQRLLNVIHICYFFFICLCICTYHMCNKYITYIVATHLYFGQLDGCSENWCSYYE